MFFFFFFLMIERPPRSPLFPSTTLFRSVRAAEPMAKPLPMAAVVLPSASRPSVIRRTAGPSRHGRSEEHTSELQSQSNLVCRLLLEKKKKIQQSTLIARTHADADRA